MLWLVLGILVLVGGAIVLFKRLMTPRLSSIGLLLTWLILVVFIITYAEQHDDPWELYVANGALAVASAVSGFLGSLMFIRTKFQSLNQRLDDHFTADAKFFDQFEKRMAEKSDQFERRIMEKLDGMSKSRKA